MPLSLSGQPGFTEIDPTTFNTGNAITQDVNGQLNTNTNFAAVRNEQFWGWYRNGDTIALPVSPEDGYKYARNELLYSIAGLSTMPISGSFTPGQQTLPTFGGGPVGGRGAGGQILYLAPWDIDVTTGVVSLVTHYFVSGGMEGPTNDGALKVMVLAQRNR
jgi:hypothetical protein